MTSILKAEGVSKRFAGVWALQGVGLNIAPESIFGLIGPNGSGKTTLLNICNGLYPPSSGRVLIDDSDVTKQPPYRRAEAGVMRTFQEARVFKTLTCLQNLRVPLLHSGAAESSVRERAWSMLELVGLEEKVDSPASELSGGQQKLLEFARAMMTRPRLVLMDEPFAGVHPVLKDQMIKSIKRVRDQGVSTVIVSHELPVLLGLADRVLCMAEGKVLFEGLPSEVSSSQLVIDAYLGSESSDNG